MTADTDEVEDDPVHTYLVISALRRLSANGALEAEHLLANSGGLYGIPKERLIVYLHELGEQGILHHLKSQFEHDIKRWKKEIIDELHKLLQAQPNLGA